MNPLQWYVAFSLFMGVCSGLYARKQDNPLWEGYLVIMVFAWPLVLAMMLVDFLESAQ